MTAMQVAHRITADEFITMPVPQRGRPWNLVGGEVIVNLPTRRHGDVNGDLLFALESWCRAQPGRGRAALPLDVRLDESNVFAPDIAWYSDERVPDPDSPPPYPMPDLAVEIRSPATWRYDVGAKRAGYERAGLPELWLVDIDAQSILVFRRSKLAAATFDVALELGAGETLTSPLLPGFALPIESAFSGR